METNDVSRTDTDDEGLPFAVKVMFLLAALVVAFVLVVDVVHIIG